MRLIQQRLHLLPRGRRPQALLPRRLSDIISWQRLQELHDLSRVPVGSLPDVIDFLFHSCLLTCTFAFCLFTFDFPWLVPGG